MTTRVRVLSARVCNPPRAGGRSGRPALRPREAHRDYTSSGSVQVMLFTDRLEVWNPGALPPSLTLEKLRVAQGSVPGNPLLAEPMYLTGHIERMGTGTRDMIQRCTQTGVPEPEFAQTDGFQVIIRRNLAAAGEVAGQVTGEVARLPLVVDGELSRTALQQRLHLKGEANFRRLYLTPALEAGILEMTRPDTPQSRLQKYRLTEKGRFTRATLVSNYFQGRRYRLDVIEQDGQPSVCLPDNTTMELRVRPGTEPARREAALQQWYRGRLRERLPPLLARDGKPRLG